VKGNWHTSTAGQWNLHTSHSKDLGPLCHRIGSQNDFELVAFLSIYLAISKTFIEDYWKTVNR